MCCHTRLDFNNHPVKVLFDNNTPGPLAHGGFHIQAQNTIRGIAANNVEVDYLRWWENEQKADVLHYFGRPPGAYIGFAKDKGMKVVVLPLLSGVGSRSRVKLFLQSVAFATARRILPALPGAISYRLGWDAFLEADAYVANTAWEGHLLSYIYGTPRDRIHIISNGVEDVFVNSQPVERGPWLVYTGLITERKRILETARAAVAAGTPLWIIGKPYSEKDRYGQEFIEFARRNPKIIRYEGPVDDRAALAAAYRQARGFVLLSARETLSLSSFEAAACECPLLLTRLPWATETFKDCARYCEGTSLEATAKCLREFYDAAPTLPRPPKLHSWTEVGGEFKRVYETILSASR